MRDQGDGRGSSDQTLRQAHAWLLTEESKLRISKYNQNIIAHLNRVHIIGNERAAIRRLQTKASSAGMNAFGHSTNEHPEKQIGTTKKDPKE